MILCTLGFTVVHTAYIIISLAFREIIFNYAYSCQIVIIFPDHLCHVIVKVTTLTYFVILLIRYHTHDDHLGLNLAYASNAPPPYLTPRGMNMKGGLFEN